MLDIEPDLLTLSGPQTGSRSEALDVVAGCNDEGGDQGHGQNPGRQRIALRHQDSGERGSYQKADEYPAGGRKLVLGLCLCGWSVAHKGDLLSMMLLEQRQ